MIYPDWVPASIAERVSEYQEQDRKNKDSWIFDIWLRLVSRPEMEIVWRFISKANYGSQLVTNGGLLGRLNSALRNFQSSPKLSPTEYKNQFLEIAKIAENLSRKLAMFSSDSILYGNSLPFHSSFNRDELDRIKLIVKPEMLNARYSHVGSIIDHYFPSISTQLQGLSATAKVEAENQSHKLKLPRKVTSDHAFRTYFVRVVADYLFSHHADFSPSRIAIFCSVALDDADITPDLIRKLYPLSDEQREMLAEQKSYQEPED